MGCIENYVEVWTRRKRIVHNSYLLLLFAVLVTSATGRGISKFRNDCGTISKLIKSKGFTFPWGNTGISYGNHSCPAGKTGDMGLQCCGDLNSLIQGKEMSLKFSSEWLNPRLQRSADIFIERKKKFDVTFKDLLTRAHEAFHAMFERTYGMLYIQHAPIFHALFQTLEAYYDTGKDSLEEKLNEFFEILTKKMFVVLNSQYEFDETYLSCATIVINEKQGGELHRQIVTSLRRSFVATRALAQGLNDADRVFSNLQQVKMSPECTLSLSQMLQCPICAELRAYKPCRPYCTKTIANCLTFLFPLVKGWNDYATAMELILERLLGPYNVEAVVEPIHIKISEAIMNFQESGADLSQEVFGKCGKAKLKSAKNYRKREATAELPVSRSVKSGTFQADGFRANRVHYDTQPSKSLEKLLKDIRHKVKRSKNLWDVLPLRVCNDIKRNYSSQLCWDGSNSKRPDRNKTWDDVNSIRNLGYKGPPNILVAEQVIILQQITEKIRASYNGLDVQWVVEKDEFDFEGSGMGSGSGDFPPDLEESDDDDPSGQINPNRNFHIPNYNFPPPPKFPSRPFPPILNPMPEHEDEEEDDDEDLSWNNLGGNTYDIPFQPPNRKDDTSDGIDFAPSPPKVNYPVPPQFAPEFPTSTTGRSEPGVTKVKTESQPPATSGTLDEASKVIAFFKLFSPIVASMLGKAFSFA